MIRVSQLKVRPGRENQLLKKTAELLKCKESDILSLSIVRQSIDARRKPDIFYIYTVETALKQEEKLLKRIKSNQVSRVTEESYHFPEPGNTRLKHRPVVVGMGPAGLFCGYCLAKAGYAPVLLERGADVAERQQDVERFWREGALNPHSNVQFGEGGAGAFSDGKLNTLVKDKNGRNKRVLEILVEFGAKPSILYDAKPHIGTDVLCEVVKRMRKEIIRLGGEVRFHSQLSQLHTEGGRVTGITVKELTGGETYELSCEQVVLAIGHSARDTFSMLYEARVPMEAKSFAVGLRVEHPQAMINLSQYGLEEPGMLGAAPYKVTAKTESGRGVYSFCMCPGGYVVNASSEEGHLAVNGMSYSGRDGKNANSAVIVSVTPEDFGSDHPLAGITFQRLLEKRAYELAGGRIPVQRYGDFRKEVEGEQAQEGSRATDDSRFLPQNKGLWSYARVSRILPPECNRAFVEGMTHFGRLIPGFDREDVLLSGVESRTSSPVRIHREENLQSPGFRGLYPCGEGAGYAGGITSAAMDGLRIAEQIAGSYAPWASAQEKEQQR